MKTIKLVLAVLFSIAIASCGGGSGSNTPAATTATGYFIDSAVQGLSYVSGGQSGTTDATGKFTYEVGKTVKFFIGNIVLGEVGAKGNMTPVDLVPAADAANAQVLKITQFLMTIDSDGNPANGITISSATKTAAQSASPINFATATDATLTSALAPLTTNTLVTTSNAQSHLTSSIYGLYAGTYSGTYSGTSSGTWTVTIDSSGAITGTGTPTAGSAFTVSGQISTSGSATFIPSGGASNGASFSGSIDVPTGFMSGTWSNSIIPGSGTWTTTTTGGVSRFNGTYTGSWSITCLVCGNTAAGTFTITVANGVLSNYMGPTTSGNMGIKFDSGTGSSSGAITGTGASPSQCSSVSTFIGQITATSSGGAGMTMTYSRTASGTPGTPKPDKPEPKKLKSA